MQRHRLPSSAFSMASGAGSPPPHARALASAAWHATTMPGVQKPHCEPWNAAIVSARAQSQFHHHAAAVLAMHAWPCA